MLDPDLEVEALRLLPSRGWTAGLFGRRDKALLVLAAATDLPYRELAVMAVGQLDIVDGAAGVTDTSGEIHVIEAVADAVLCGPCALARWRRVVDAEVTGTSAAGMRRLFKKAPVVTSESRHVCREPEPAAAKTLAVPLFPPINQWGYLPLPIQPLSRHAISVLARQVQTGLPAHRDLDVDEVVDILSPPETEAGEPAPPRPAYDWAAANQKKRTPSPTSPPSQPRWTTPTPESTNSSTEPETSNSTDSGPALYDLPSVAMRALIDELRAAQTKIVLLEDRAAGRCTRCHHGSGFHYQLTKSRFAQREFQRCRCEALVG